MRQTPPKHPYNSPETAALAKEMQSRGEPYKGIHANEAYKKRIETATDVAQQFVDPNLFARVVAALPQIEAGDLGKPAEDPDFVNTIISRLNPSTPHTLTFSAVDGTVSPTTFTGQPGETVSVTVTPDSGFAFDKWNDAGQTRVFTVGNTDQSFTAQCQSTAALKYHINAVAFNGTIVAKVGGIEVTLPYECDPGTVVNLTVTPSTDATWKKWSDGNTDINRDVTVNADVHLAAYCNEDPAIRKVDLSAPEDEGGVVGYLNVGATDPSYFMFPFYLIDDTTFSAEFYPAAGRVFEKWNDGNTDNPRTIKINGSDVTHTCSTTVQQITLKVTCAEHGTILAYKEDGTQIPTSVITTGYTADYGTRVILKVTPDSSGFGYTFDKWSDDVLDNPRTVIMHPDDTGTTITLDAEMKSAAISNSLTFSFADPAATNTIKCEMINEAYYSYTPNDSDSWQPFTQGVALDCTGHESVNIAAKCGTSHCYGFSGNFISVSGDVRTLLDYSNPENATLYDSQFYEGTGKGLFTNCTSLQVVDFNFLPFNFLTAHCYQDMFKGCTSLVGMPSLEAVYSIDVASFESMFEDCTSLTKLPGLPKVYELANYCYSYMFKGCVNLEGTANINATETAPYCCYHMFDSCQHLFDAQIYPEVVAEHAYEQMFYGCTSLNSVSCFAKDISAASAVDDMFSSCSGYQFYGHSIAGWDLTSNGIGSASSIEFDDCLTFRADSEFTMKIDCMELGKVWYLKKGLTTWEPFQAGEPISSGTFNPYTIWVRGIAGSSTVAGISGGFTYVGGDLAYLIDYKDPDHVVLSDNQFYKPDASDPRAGTGLFEDNPQLVDHTISLDRFYSLEKNCFRAMFANTGITFIPSIGHFRALADGCCALMFMKSKVEYIYEFPNAAPHSKSGTCYGCYDGMFYQCTNLIGVPMLPAKDLSGGNECYKYMFAGCTNLQKLPSDMLPATALSVGCYAFMFQGCTSLQYLPDLPATNLTDCYWNTDTYSEDDHGWVGCYTGMFSNCTGLIDASGLSLPATTLSGVCYAHMFHSCTSLTSIPDLSAVSIYAFGCFKEMFAGCTSLNAAPTLSATSLPLAIHDAEHSAYDYQRGVCQGMFKGCTALVSGPTLPATQLTDYCYKQMFNGCTNLKTITCRATNLGTMHSTGGVPLATIDWVASVPASTTGTFTGSAELHPDSGTATNKWSRNSVSGIPADWSYTSN